MNPLESFAVSHPLTLLTMNVFGDQLGLPIPSYPSLVLAGAFASEHGAPNPRLIMPLVLVACLLADSIWYWLGARFGDDLSRRLARHSPRLEAALSQGRRAYLRHGAVVLVLAKFIPGAGAVSTLLAGQMAMPRMHFVIYSLIGSTLWGSSALVLGAGFGGPILQLFDCIKEYLMLVLAVAGTGVVGLLVSRAALGALKHTLHHPFTK